MSSAVRIETGRAPEILAPFICEPTVTTSSTSESTASSCEKTLVDITNGNINSNFFNMNLSPKFNC